MTCPGRLLVLLAMMVAAMATPAAPQVAHTSAWPESASKADIDAARAVFEQWLQAFRDGRYEDQWALIDPRIRFWISRDRWRKGVARAARRNLLKTVEISAVTPALGRQIPCTEQHHCHRPDVRYVVFLITSTYSKTTPPQPEYAAMSLSDEGWRFGGGTFPDRPLGETSVIMTKEDEKRYKVDQLDLRKNLGLQN